MKIELVERNTPCGLDHACVDCSQNKKERKENRTCDPSFALDIFLMLSSSLYSCFLSSEVPASLRLYYFPLIIQTVYFHLGFLLPRHLPYHAKGV